MAWEALREIKVPILCLNVTKVPFKRMKIMILLRHNSMIETCRLTKQIKIITKNNDY